MRRKTLSEIMGFGGYAPEVINGRLAQLGFVAGLGAEIFTGESFPVQFAHHGPSLALTAGVITLATFVPLMRSTVYTADPKTMKPDKIFGPFSESAEIFNSRAAMVGIVAILGIEMLKGGPLITLNAKPNVVQQDTPLTASYIRQNAIEKSRSDGFEPEVMYSTPPAGVTPAAPFQAPLQSEAPAVDTFTAEPEAFTANESENARNIKELTAQVAQLQSELNALRAGSP